MSERPKEKKHKRDLESFFAKVCSDNKFQPVMNIFRKFIDKSQGTNFVIDVHDFDLTIHWALLLAESLKEETDPNLMVKKLILNNNRMSAESFNKVLEQLIEQEGLEAIVYINNELDLESVEQI